MGGGEKKGTKENGGWTDLQKKKREIKLNHTVLKQLCSSRLIYILSPLRSHIQ